MKKFFVLILVVCFLFQTGLVGKAEARGKLLLGIGLTVAGVTGILVGREEEDVLDKEYDFPTYVYMGVYDEIMGVYISELWDYQIDPDPATIVEKDQVVAGWAYGTNDYAIYMYVKNNHHKVYKTEKRINVLGQMGLVATGVGVTLIIDYLLEKTRFTEKTGLEVQTVAQPGYYKLALAKRY